MLVLAGLAVLVVGFALRVNPLAVVLAAAFASGLAASLTPLAIVAAFGKAFNDTRFISATWVVLPVVAMLEARGLKARAQGLVARLNGATTGRMLTAYLLLRQITAALGLTSIAGHAQTGRPLVAPMAQAAAEMEGADEVEVERVRAMAAATDNIGLFFGEDIFLAISSILLMKGLLDQAGFVLSPIQLSVWAIPSAIAAFVVHGWRLRRLDARLRRKRS